MLSCRKRPGWPKTYKKYIKIIIKLLKSLHHSPFWSLASSPKLTTTYQRPKPTIYNLPGFPLAPTNFQNYQTLSKLPNTPYYHSYQPSQPKLFHLQTQAHSTHLTLYPTTTRQLHYHKQPSITMCERHRESSSFLPAIAYRLGQSP